MKTPLEFCKKVADISTDFEKLNTDLKRQYIISNIILYNNIASTIAQCKGTFGTGYPFYVLDKDLQGALPVIAEQIRYNDALVEDATHTKFREWLCATCLSDNYHKMPDLKQICKTCPNIENELKPRKLINRLPDLDLWMVCDEEDIKTASGLLASQLKEFGFTTSDVDPLNTIAELEEIVTSIRQNQMPTKKLPIDTHLIDTISLYSLICEVPDKLDYCIKHEGAPPPYLAIHPLSLRKKWQKDDCAYNFIHDYLSSFSEMQMDPEIQKVLNETRKEIARKYSLDQLYKFLIETGPDSVARRHKTPGLREAFDKRIEGWREL